jgi:hypothetical protein
MHQSKILGYLPDVGLGWLHVWKWTHAKPPHCNQVCHPRSTNGSRLCQVGEKEPTMTITTTIEGDLKEPFKQDSSTPDSVTWPRLLLSNQQSQGVGRKPKESCEGAELGPQAGSAELTGCRYLYMSCGEESRAQTPV